MTSAEEILSIKTFQQKQSISTIVDKLICADPPSKQDEFLSKNNETFRSAKTQLKSLIEALKRKRQENSVNQQQFSKELQHNFGKLRKEKLEACQSSHTKLESQVCTILQRNKRNIHKLSENQDKVHLLTKKQQLIDLIQMFRQKRTSELEELIASQSFADQMNLGSLLCQLALFIRHDEDLFADCRQRIEKYIDAFENKHLKTFIEATSIDEAKEICQIMHEFNESFSCIKVFINNHTLFTRENFDLFSFWETRLSSPFDQVMKSDLEAEIDAFFEVISADFSQIWFNSIQKIFPNPIFVA